MKHLYYILYKNCVAALPMLMLAACNSSLPDKEADDDTMMFYVKQHTVSGAAGRAIIDDVNSLNEKRLPIYLFDEQKNFTDATEVGFYNNGLWRNDDLKWNDKEYILYAYIKSEADGSDGSGLSVSTSGQTVTITQPGSYTNDDTKWTDYLLSYRVSANGKDRPLVQLEFERVTAGVELYVSFQESAAHAAQITGVTFAGVQHAATMTLSRHASPGDEPIETTGMRNGWGVRSTGDAVSYKYGSEESPINVNGYDGSGDKYNTNYRVMRFLTIPQTLTDANTLKIDYQVQQTADGAWEKYSATFQLNRFQPSGWIIGHLMRYRLNIDISVKLEAVVEEWNDTNYMEGTFLPD